MAAIVRDGVGGKVIQLGPVSVRSILNGRDTAGAFDLLELSAGPDGIGPPPHIHPNTHETFVVVEGSVEFTVGAEKTVAHAGTTVHVPPGVPHAFRYAGPGRNRFLATLIPSVNMENYFVGLQALVRESIPPDRAKAFALMSRHDTLPA
jgi:mannose-6-phosphate isomerase-like protein (cupin superfamily)